MSKIRILVTGANGYLGSGVVKQLLDDGFDVIATDLKSEFIDHRAKIVLGNIFEMKDPFNKLGNPDVLLHMAWRDGFVHDSINHINDLPNHFLFIQKMCSSGIKRVAVVGTMHEIGFYEGCVDEATPCNPQSFYGISKNALRNMVQIECKNNNVVFQWLRGFYIVSDAKNGNSIFSKISIANSEGKTVFPFSSGMNKYDFLDYCDFCKYMALAVEQDSINGVINICSGEPIALKDKVEEFIRYHGFKISLVYGAFPDRAYDSKAIWGDNTKIKEIIANEK